MKKRQAQLQTQRHLLALAAAGALSAPAAVWADDEAQAPELPAVVVKGEKIERRLNETLSSVTVRTARDLREREDTSLADVLSHTPGVYTQADNENWGIRGVPVAGFDDQGPATLNGAVSVYVDGAPQSHRLLTLSPGLLWDVEQVEIFRGAQSTVQGRNALAGAVVVQTRNPSYKPSLALQANAGSDRERGVAVAGGGAIVEGLMAGRIAADFREDDGYIRNETLGRNANAHRASNVRGKLLIQPSDQLDMLLTLAHTESRQGANGVVLDDDVPQYYRLFLNTDAFDRIRQDTVSLKLDYYLNDTWTLTSITSNTRSEYDALLDFDEGPDDRWEVARKHKSRLVNQELRLGYRSATVRGHVGLYAGRATNDFNDQLDVDGSAFGGVVGATKVNSRAVFGEVNWRFQPRWELIAGLRYDRERNQTNVVQDDFSAPNAVSNSFNAALPKVGLSYEVAANQQVGAQVQKGYRSGGVNVRAGSGHDPYDPEYTLTYELSHRGAWLDKRLRTSTNVYYTDWKDQQVSVLDSTGSFFEVHNAARSRMKGLELAADYDATKALRLSAGMSYNDARYKDFTDSDGRRLDGQRFLYAPRVKVSLGAGYRFANRLFVNAVVVRQDSAPSQYLFDAGGNVSGVRRSDSHTLLNLNAEYRMTKGATLSFYVKNLLDEKYVTNNRSGGPADVGAPRKVGVALRYDL
ncbi:TonB-dependent receptor [Azohydromonas aeria]|uniref:TonB-dependent receptor n=1 Tax=Azohydromonas aeria TaxID=2590212 RepID=UPI0012FB6348|nr:TonB-dependent receptor [Azohydromonas aeria]